ncbi:MAG: PHD finger domain-containing protein, partial [Planctomycetaceae bacterium]
WPFRDQGVQGTALILEPEATAVINGETIHDIALLSDRDEIVVGLQRIYFSSETIPVVSTFHLEEGARRPSCGVCRGPIEDGAPVVQCPRCTRLFHQSDGREHWTYRSECPFCKHPTSLTGESAWKPETEDGDVD